ncbi:MAG TPA: endonuclease domain-containing protein [Dehalococcoidia bacterium]|nr:endonuclease domain-containing protein [Dehalococcoidia bacterium]
MLKTKCRICLQKRQSTRQYWKRAAKLKRLGLTPADYEIFLEVQGGLCAFCGRVPTHRRLAVDHNHKTGKVRGLLCYRCNRFLVGFHTISTAKRLLAYLLTRD